MTTATEMDMSEEELAALIGEFDALGEEIANMMPVPEKTEPKVDDDGIEIIEEIAVPAAKVEEVEEIEEVEAVTPAKSARTPAPTTEEVSELDELAALDAALGEVETVEEAIAVTHEVEAAPVKPVETASVATVEPVAPKRSVEEIEAPLGAPKPAKLDYFIDPKKFTEETAVNDANLDNCMMQQSSLRAFYGAQAAYAEQQYNRFKTRFDVLEARLYESHRKLLGESGEKVTEKAVENAVRQDPRWRAMKDDLHGAETIASVNRALVMSLVDRRDMLIQMGSDRRAEAQGQMRLSVAQEDQESLANRAANAARAALGKR